MQKKNEESRKIFYEIIRLININAHDGLNKFYEKYGRLICATAKNYGCSQAQADSVVNQVLTKVWKKADSLFDIENPDGWIYTVAKNCAKDEVNVPWNLELNESICKSKDCFEDIINKDSFEYLISCLKEEEKSIMTMKFMAESSFKEIANCFEKPTPTITSVYYRSLEKIKKFLKNKKVE